MARRKPPQLAGPQRFDPAKPPTKLAPRERQFTLRAPANDGAEFTVDKDKRTLRMSFSSDAPIEDPWFGINEVLSHDQGAIRMGTRQNNMPLLYNHDRDQLLGVIEGIDVASGKGYADVRFGKDERGEWAMNQAADGILINASFMYRVYAYEFVDDEEGNPGVDDDDDDDDVPTYRATDWEIFEISLVTVPADASVGVGRAESEATENPVVFTKHQLRSTSIMTDKTAGAAGDDPNKGAAAAAAAEAEKQRERDAERDRIRSDERKRLHAIRQLAADLGLGNDFINDHSESSVEVAREAALKEVARQRKDHDGIQAAERERIQEIEALSKKSSVDPKITKKAIEDKCSVKDFRGIVLDQMLLKGGSIVPASNARSSGGGSGLDLSRAEKGKYSLRKAILAAASNDWSDAGYEREVSNTLEKDRKLTRHSGGVSFFMPTDISFQVEGAKRSQLIEDLLRRNGFMQRAAYEVGSGSGGQLVGTELLAADFIEVLRNRTVTGQLGAKYLTGLTENINIPRQDTQTQTYWVGESVALTESEATFDQVQLRPHVVGGLSRMSRLMLQQSTPAIEMLVREDLLLVEALAVDLAALNGTGSSAQPTGIANTSGIGSVVGGTNGANLTFDALIQLYATPLVANAPQENLGFAMNAKCKGYLATLKATTGQYLWQPAQSVGGPIPDSVVGYKYAVSNQLPFNLTKGTATAMCSEIIFGNWQELIIGEWGVTEIMVNPYDSTGFTQGDVLIRVFQTVDVGLRHPSSFSVTSDILTPGF
jgi:HK97 family phage major capsid protein